MPTTPETLAEEYRPKLDGVLEETIVDFWYPRCVDDEYGGYRLGYDADGESNDETQKMIVTQSRMVWFFSRLAERDDDSTYLDAAETGYDFLIESMWDDDHGGFHWEVSREGEVKKPNKHLYGQSFAVYALAAYARASGRDEPLDRANRVFDLLETHAYDETYGGYVEYFTPEWTPIETGQTYLETIEPDWSEKESGDAVLDPTLKLMNTHLHLMEAFTTLYRVSGRRAVGDRLTELLVILTNTVVRKDLTACTDKYTRKWEAKLDRDEFRIVSYGHDVETVWLVMETCDALEIPPTLFEDLFERLFAYSLEYGYDHDHGGFYFFGPFEQPATNRIKAWWVQAEALVSSLRMYELTGESIYRETFEETYAFVENHQLDREHGEWHSGVDDDRRPLGRKGASYKGAYHNGRAMFECLSTLDSFARTD